MGNCESQSAYRNSLTRQTPSIQIIVNVTATPTAMRAWNFEVRKASDGFRFYLTFITTAITPEIPQKTKSARLPMFQLSRISIAAFTAQFP
jgi:hypothetical protein